MLSNLDFVLSLVYLDYAGVMKYDLCMTSARRLDTSEIKVFGGVVWNLY